MITVSDYLTKLGIGGAAPVKPMAAPKAPIAAPVPAPAAAPKPAVAPAAGTAPSPAAAPAVPVTPKQQPANPPVDTPAPKTLTVDAPAATSTTATAGIAAAQADAPPPAPEVQGPNHVQQAEVLRQQIASMDPSDPNFQSVAQAYTQTMGKLDHAQKAHERAQLINDSAGGWRHVPFIGHGDAVDMSEADQMAMIENKLNPRFEEAGQQMQASMDADSKKFSWGNFLKDNVSLMLIPIALAGMMSGSKGGRILGALAALGAGADLYSRFGAVKDENFHRAYQQRAAGQQAGTWDDVSETKYLETFGKPHQDMIGLERMGAFNMKDEVEKARQNTLNNFRSTPATGAPP